MERSDAAPNLPRILLVGGDGGPSGVPRHICQIACTLADEARITVASDLNRGGYDALKALGVPHIQIAGLKSGLRPGRVWRAWANLKALIGQEERALIWMHARMPVVLVRLAMAFTDWRPPGGARVAVTLHGLPFTPGHRPLLAALSRRLERAMMRRCPPLHMVFLTGGMADTYACAIGPEVMARHSVHVLSNSSDIGPLPKRPRDTSAIRIVMTGRTGFQKNYERAAELFAKLPSNFELVLCGPGTEQPGFQRDIARRVGDDALTRIRFVGSVSDIRPVLASADLYLLSSRYEGLPIGALEAFEAGLPLALTPFETAPDIVAVHPMAEILDLTDLKADAARLALLHQTFAQDREGHSRAIKAAWARHFSYEAWQADLRALIGAFIPR